MILVRLPAMLGGGAVTITDDVQSLDQLTAALRRLRPDIDAQLDDTIFNFAVNDEMLLHDAGHKPLRDGDIVEIVPAISGG